MTSNLLFEITSNFLHFLFDIDFIKQSNKLEVNIVTYILDKTVLVFAAFQQQKVPNKSE